jgi:hypothetical protein
VTVSAGKTPKARSVAAVIVVADSSAALTALNRIAFPMTRPLAGMSNRWTPIDPPTVGQLTPPTLTAATLKGPFVQTELYRNLAKMGTSSWKPRSFTAILTIAGAEDKALLKSNLITATADTGLGRSGTDHSSFNQS